MIRVRGMGGFGCFGFDRWERTVGIFGHVLPIASL